MATFSSNEFMLSDPYSRKVELRPNYKLLLDRDNDFQTHIREK